MSESASPVWPPEAIYPANGLSAVEQGIEPRAWRFVTSDGYHLGVLTWPVPQGARKRGCILVLHGVQSHAGWYHGLGRRLAAHGYEAHFPDRRGSGSNTESRGHTPSAKRLIDDLLELNSALRAHEHDQQVPHAVAGISWGGKLAVCLAAHHPQSFQAAALICPGLHPRVGVTGREKLGVGLALLTGKAAVRHFPIPLAEPRLFTENPQAQAFIANDPLSLRTGSAALLFASRVIDGWVKQAPDQIRIPILLMLAGHDQVVNNEQTREYFKRIKNSNAQIVDYPSGHHTLEFDPEPSSYARDLCEWLDTHMS